jgi:uncharacterized membrane protein
MKFKKILPLLMTVLLFGFPFLIHYGLPYFGAKVFAVLLFVIFVLRIVFIPAKNVIFKITMMAVVSCFCGVIAFYNSAELLFYYPVLMSLFVAMMFFLSLYTERTLIEEFAQLSGKEYPQGAQDYMRGLTKSWIALLVFNAIAAAYFACCQSADAWLLYNGVVAYAIITGFMILEVIYRGIYRRKNFPDL